MLRGRVRNTYSDWRRTRREEACRAANDGCRQHIVFDELQASVNSTVPTAVEACKGELEFASDKKKKEFLKGINENTILPCERTEEDVREAAAMLKHTQRNRKERKSWEARQTNKRTHEKVAILNKTYLLDSSLQGREILPQWVFDSMQITKTDTLELSDLVLSRWPGRHQQLVHWHAVLTGACIVSPSYVASAGEAGSCLSFSPAIRSKRFVWISDAWEREHPKLMRIISSAFRRAQCKWERLESKQDFLTSTHLFVDRATGQVRKFSAIALVSALEKVYEEPSLLIMALCD